MKNLVLQFLKDESGQDLSEYAVLIGVVALGVLGVIAAQGRGVSPILHSANNLVQTAATVAAS